MEASALTHASQRGLLARRSPLLKLQGDGRLIAMVRSGNAGAFETIVDRYQGRLLGFCRQMLGSTEDAEDVLQEVFVNAYRAMLADEREINLRPWLYRIARNRCLNHLRKPTADAQESMDMVPMVEAGSTAEKVHNREEFRQLLTDVCKLPETQRSALLLREMDAMSYEEIAHAMDTSVPSVKSLLVRARISLAEASQARQLTCGEVRLELAEAAEGLRKVSGPVRRHVRDCDECSDFRSQVRSNDKVLAALFPAGGLLALKGFIAGKLGFGGALRSGAATGAAGAGAGGAATGAVGSVGARSEAVAPREASAPSAGRSARRPSPASSPPPSSPPARSRSSSRSTRAPRQPAGAGDRHQAPRPPRRAPRPSPTRIPHSRPRVAATAATIEAPARRARPGRRRRTRRAPDPATAAGDSAEGSTVTELERRRTPTSTSPAPTSTDATARRRPASSGGTVVVTVGGSTAPPAESAPPAEEAARRRRRANRRRRNNAPKPRRRRPRRNRSPRRHQLHIGLS